jgi:SLA1 homology domain 1, SHD1
MNTKFVCGICFVLFTLTLQARTWTEVATGRTVNADFVRLDGENVVIRLAGGVTTKIALARLSEEDQAFVKEQTASKPALGTTGGDAKKDKASEIIGTWKGFMANSDGSPHGQIQLVITDKEITATNPQGGGTMGTGTYSISGRRIDAKGLSGQYEGKDYEGIWEVEGKTLKWCSANDNPNSARPSKMQTDMQAGAFLMVLEKQ